MSRLVDALESVQPEHAASIEAFLPTCERLLRLLSHLLGLATAPLALADDIRIRFVAAWLRAAQTAQETAAGLTAALARVIVIVGRFDGLWTGSEHELGLAAKALSDLAFVRPNRVQLDLTAAERSVSRSAAHCACPAPRRCVHGCARACVPICRAPALIRPDATPAQREATARHLSSRVADMSAPSLLVTALVDRTHVMPPLAPALSLLDGVAPSDGLVIDALRPSAWELVDHTEAASAVRTRAWAQNGSALDLSLVGATALETVAVGGPSADRPSVGAQSAFDSEAPTARESIWIRAFRRSLRPVPSIRNRAAIEMATPAPVAAESPAPAATGAGKSDSPIIIADDSPTVATVALPSEQRPSKKRRGSAVEGLTTDSQDAAPAPKKAKAKPRIGMGAAGGSSKLK